jgi:hypothetical protein
MPSDYEFKREISTKRETILFQNRAFSQPSLPSPQVHTTTRLYADFSFSLHEIQALSESRTAGHALQCETSVFTTPADPKHSRLCLPECGPVGSQPTLRVCANE